MDYSDKLKREYLYVSGENDFADVWEKFTCKLLNLEHKTAEIVIRKPPEQGVDLFYQEKGKAYQCKSVETGLDSGFNVTKAKASIISALQIKINLGWNDYYLCTNVNVTGTQEADLKNLYNALIILPKSYWITLCEKFSSFVEVNFRKELVLPKASKTNSYKSISDFYTDDMLSKIKLNNFDIYFYSQEYEKIYKVEVSESFLVLELSKVITAFLNRPDNLVVKYGNNTEVKVTNILRFNDVELEQNKTLKELNIKANSIIQLCVDFSIMQGNRYSKDKVLGYMTNEMLTESVNPEKAKMEALEKAKIEYLSLFTKMDKRLNSDEQVF